MMTAHFTLKAAESANTMAAVANDETAATAVVAKKAKKQGKKIHMHRFPFSPFVSPVLFYSLRPKIVVRTEGVFSMISGGQCLSVLLCADFFLPEEFLSVLLA